VQPQISLNRSAIELTDTQKTLNPVQADYQIKPYKIILFTPYYKARQSDRQAELIYCLQKNIECHEIQKIVLLIDDNHQPELTSSKIEIINLSSRPTYLDWVELTEKHCPDQISILANTDIYFDKSVSQVREIFSTDPNAFVTISRYEQEGLEQILHEKPHWSQDVWAILGNYQLTDSLKKTLKIPLGVPRCDNKIAYLFAIYGAQVYNPCNYIKTVHIQETQLRYYDKYGDSTILGGTAWVYPSSEINKPSKLQIDIWTLNASEIIDIRINKGLLDWKKSQTEQVKAFEVQEKKLSTEKNSIKNVIVLDSDWQYPAITEKYAYEMVNNKLPKDNCPQDIVYFGFPWATLIDQSLHNKTDTYQADLLMEKLKTFQIYLKEYKRVITVCQHIHLLKFERIFNEVGITDIFWSHTTKYQKVLPSYPTISLYPFPLYPVQASGIEPSEIEKKYLYSFVGSRGLAFHLTDTRNKIIDYLSGDERGLIITRDQWHYNKVVYDYQVLKRVKETDELIEKSATEEFKQVMQQSIFSLCPSGSGPNSIRLWESIGFGVIPVILSDTYLPPGNLSLWDEATVSCPETLEDIKALPERLAEIADDKKLLNRKRNALKKIWTMYGQDYFVYDIIKLFINLVINKERNRRVRSNLTLPSQ
jgi:hypothetical protein